MLVFPVTTKGKTRERKMMKAASYAGNSRTYNFTGTRLATAAVKASHLFRDT